MTLRTFATGAVLGAMSFVALAQDANEDAKQNAADTLFANYEIREASRPISEDPGWSKPRSIVFVVPSIARIPIPDFENWLRGAAPGVALHFVSSREEFEAAAASADGVLLGNCDWLDPDTINVHWVQAFSAGVERCLARPFDWKDDILLTNARGMAGPFIAEHVITMMLMLTHQMPAYYRNQQENRWGATREIIETVRPVSGRTLLVLGLGGIGAKVAEKAAALGMRVNATRNSSRSGPDFVDYVGLPDEMSELTGKADFVVNTLPLTPQTAGIFDKQFFATMKESAYFINVGRGASVVTADLVEALENGAIAGAGLDVTDPEPLPAEHALWQMPNVVITPHSSSFSRSGSDDMFIFIRENLRRYVNGEKMLNVVDPALGY